MIYLQLFFNFFYVGAFAFGGGYTMIPMFQRIVTEYGWLSLESFTDMIAVSQMTPGPIAVNLATFVGYRTAGVFGSLVATLGVCLPSFLLVLLLMRFVMKFEEKPVVVSVLKVLRPAVAGLIAAAAYLIALNSPLVRVDRYEQIGRVWAIIDPVSFVMALLIMGAIYKFKQHPILYVIGAGVVGIFFF